MLHPDQLRAPNPAFRSFNVPWAELSAETYQLLAQPCPTDLPAIQLRGVISDLVTVGVRINTALKLLQLWITNVHNRRRLRRLILSTRADLDNDVLAGIAAPVSPVGKENLLLNHIHERYSALFTIDDLEQSAKEALNMHPKAVRRSFTNLHKYGKVLTVVEPSNEPGLYVTKLVFGQLDFAKHLHAQLAGEIFTVNDIVASCARSGTPVTPSTARTYLTYLFKRGELHRVGTNVDGHETYRLTPPQPRLHRQRLVAAALEFYDHLYARHGYWPFEAWTQELADGYGKASRRSITDYLTVLQQHGHLQVEALGGRNAKSVYRLLPADQCTPPDVQAEVDRLLSLPSPAAARAYQVLRKEFGVDVMFAASYSQLTQLLGCHRNSLILLLAELQTRGYLWREPFTGGTQKPSKYMLFDV